jgi:hypothetical protein
MLEKILPLQEQTNVSKLEKTFPSSGIVDIEKTDS